MTPLQILALASGLIDIVTKLRALGHSDATPVPPEAHAQVVALCKAAVPGAWDETHIGA